MRVSTILATNVVDGSVFAYAYDDIGNRLWSHEFGTNCTYAANELNQYTNIVRGGVVEQSAFDADGNQTDVVTGTGRWLVEYNGENRPVRWTRPADGMVLEMSYDSRGRRVRSDAYAFVYDDYLNVGTTVWDPTEPIATRPIVWLASGGPAHYFHDGNKNVSEGIVEGGGLSVHYKYAHFGAIVSQEGDSAFVNPWRFSSECADDDTATAYYNSRYYDLLQGRWLSRDSSEELGGVNLFCFCFNRPVSGVDVLGLGYLECLGDCIKANDPMDKILDHTIDKIIMGSPGVPKVFLEWIARHVMRDEKLAKEIGLARKLGGPLAWKPMKIIGDWLSLNRAYCAKAAKAHAVVATVYGVVMFAVESDCAVHCIGECSYDGNNIFNVDYAVKYYSDMLLSLFGD